ncbi:hypothetical protein DYB35_011950 [Aphanomyces astaci]|uniref:Glutaredoxin domain-containing protein n=1 Tax=Aphanomyces astaci TaxID=112090 RepID=A0A3R6WQ33_APHAT|nr:hypothetical protein DYB35_011950 [Aphanomyces astaci]
MVMAKSMLLVAATLELAVADFPPSWGVQDVWVHTSTWYAGRCTCLCQPLCSHPSDIMRTNLVSGGLIPRFNNYSVPRCDDYGKYYASSAISAVGQTHLKNYFPVGFSRDLENMWSPSAPEGNQPTFAYPCGAPKVVTDNIGKEVKVSDLRAAFKQDWGADVVLQCLDGAFTDVLTCWSKAPAMVGSGEIFPSKIQDCSPQIAATDECTNATTKILAFSIPTKAPVTDAPSDAPVTTAVVPVTTTVTPKSTTVTPKSTTVTPKSTTVTPKSTTVTPNSTTVTPNSTTVTPHPTTVTPNSTTAPTPTPTEVPSEVDIWTKFYARNARCAIFGEEGCTYCAAAKALFKQKKAKYDYFGVWMDNPNHIPSGMDVYYSLLRLTKKDSLPNVWIGGKFIGGFDDLKALNASGTLNQLLKDAKCLQNTTNITSVFGYE